MNVAEALAGIPGWERAISTELEGGTTNSSWLVDNGPRRGVLKVDAEPRRPPFNTRKEEARIQAMAAGAGLANPVIHASDTVLLTEFVDGEVWTAATLDDPARLVALARALRELHGLPLSGRAFDALAAARAYARGIDGVVESTLRDKLRIIEQTPRPRELALCHNDLVAENILSAPGIRLLDWEYACDNDPFFDLAIIVSHHGLGEDQANTFLDAYCGGAGDDERARLRAYCRLYDALLWLWETAQGIAAGSGPDQ